MSQQRFTPSISGDMIVVADGEWVRHEDYAALAARCGELERDARDARRYRWLREQSHPFGSIWYSLTALDDEVDRALASQAAETKDGDA